MFKKKINLVVASVSLAKTQRWPRQRSLSARVRVHLRNSGKRPRGGSGSTGAARWVSASAVVSGRRRWEVTKYRRLCYRTNGDFLGVRTGPECGMEK